MATYIQLLLPLICVVLAERKHLRLRGLQSLTRQKRDLIRSNEPLNENVDYNYGHTSWPQHFFGPQRRPSLSDGTMFSYNRHHKHRPYSPYNPLFNGGMYPYLGSHPLDMAMGFGQISSNTDPMPAINNFFDMPGEDYNSHKYPPLGVNYIPNRKPIKIHILAIDDKNPEEKPKMLPMEAHPTAQQKEPKLNKANTAGIKVNTDESSPKINDSEKVNMSLDKEDNDDKQIGLDEKKDYLLVGSGSNGNNFYLLHENYPNPNSGVVPNVNQPGNNIIYVPYNPDQSKNQVYVANGRTTHLPTNQVSPDKQNVHGYNNDIRNLGYSTVNLNSASHNPGYVMVYSNGQLLQIPGVLVNSVQNNVPLQNVNPVQGSNYIVTNTVPNNVQNMPVIQNPGTNVVFTHLPNQGTGGQIVVLIPNCVTAIPNICAAGAVVQNPLQGVNNAAMSTNGLSNNVAGNQPNQYIIMQPAVTLSNGVPNGYVLANMVPNQGQGSNVAVNNPSQDATLHNQNVPLQQGFEMPVNSGSNGYNQPMVSQQKPNVAAYVPNTGNTLNNSLPVSSASNGYNQPLVSNQGLQGINAVVNSRDAVIDQTVKSPATSIPNSDETMVLDDNNVLDFTAQPAIMISGFKETVTDKTEKQKTVYKNDERHASTKKEKENIDTEKSKVLTNK